MATFVLDKERGIMVNKVTGEPMLTEEKKRRPLQCPSVIGDLPGYQSPIDGKWIEGRRARRYDLESNNCVDANDLAPATSGKLKNERFAKKRGLEHLLEK